MADEPTPIIVPAVLTKAYMAARTHGRRAEALSSIMNDDDVWGDVCKDCCQVLESHKDRAESVQYALVRAMDIRCPCRPNLISKQPRELTCDEVLDGKCAKCGAKIVVEGASHE
jgi:hypothetical protein